MRGRLDTQSDERSLNLDAVRASLEEAAAVLAEMAELDAPNRGTRVTDVAR